MMMTIDDLSADTNYTMAMLVWNLGGQSDPSSVTFVTLALRGNFSR